MDETARPPRRYDASRRRAQSALTRRRIIEAAGELFVANGYRGTTVPMIASAAEVAVETIYRSAEGKAGLLAAAVHAALAGSAERAERPSEERVGIRRVIDAADPQAQILAFASTWPGNWARVGPLLRVLGEAAAADDELVALQRDLDAQWLDGVRRFAALLAERGSLRADLTVERAADQVWALTGQANYESLVVRRGWSPDDYRDWLASMLAAALLTS
jgi:AcrR family transcriptional regulator